MKVLDFEDALIDHLPDEVGNLFHLHYLSLKNTKVKTLPRTMGKLVNLESLNLKKTLVSELPVELKHLKKLRYLVATPSQHPPFSYGKGVKIQDGFGSLMDLQTLGNGVQLNSKAVEELKKLRQLRKLGIQLVNGNDMNDLFSSIANMEDLIALGIELINREDKVDMESMTSPPIRLECFYLMVNLTKLPNWIPKLQNLVRLVLAWGGLTEDPFKVLHSLTELSELFLVEAYNGEGLHINQGWFLKLRYLTLINLKGLKCIMIEDGAMPLLEHLLIGECARLKEIPTGIENLRNLKKLFFHNMPHLFESGIITHETLEKLRHIPEVLANSQDERGEPVFGSIRG